MSAPGPHDAFGVEAGTATCLTAPRASPGEEPRETPTDDAAIVLSHTVPARPWLCPELVLRLVTAECPLWRAGEGDLDRFGLRPPYWAFAWGAGQALARWLLDRPDLTRGRRVLDVGAGSGIAAIAAARVGAASATAVDVDPLSRAATLENAAANGVRIHAVTGDALGEPPRADVVLLADVFYDDVGARTVPWMAEAATRALVLVADPPRGRSGTEAAALGIELEALVTYLAPADVGLDGSTLEPIAVRRVVPRTR